MVQFQQKTCTDYTSTEFKDALILMVVDWKKIVSILSSLQEENLSSRFFS
jgi:hypothetical protein